MSQPKEDVSKDDKKQDVKKTKPCVWLIYYSKWGHVHTLAEAIAIGLKLEEVDVQFHRLPDENVEKEKFIERLAEADAFMFGIPTRFGTMPAQVKTFFDSLGAYWRNGLIRGKMAGFFFSTSTQGGGQETTAFTCIPILTHHGLIYVPFGYVSQHLTNMTEVHGGSPYGSGTFGIENHPTKLEKQIAEDQGKYFGGIVKKYWKGQQ